MTSKLDQIADELRTITISLIDKSHQLEALFQRFPNRPDSDEGAASVRASRTILREHLIALRSFRGMS